MFDGTVFSKLDSKGRLTIPSRFREVLESASQTAMVVTRHPDGCLVAYDEVTWAQKRAQLCALPYEKRGFVRFVLGSAQTLVLDRLGRVLIPADLRRLAQLQTDVVLVGLGGHFEIWQPSLYEKLMDSVMQDLNPGDFVF